MTIGQKTSPCRGVLAKAAAALMFTLGGCSTVPIAPDYSGGDAGAVVASIMAPQELANRYFLRLEELGADGTRVADAGMFSFINDGSSWSRRPDFSDNGMLGVVMVGRLKPGAYRVVSFDRDSAPALQCTPSAGGSTVIKVERNAVTYVGRFRHAATGGANRATVGIVSNDVDMDLRLAQLKSGALPRNLINAALSPQAPMACKAP
jgi:hypothetical protein